MTEGVFRPTTRARRWIGRSLRALLVLGGALLVALSYEPAAAAATTFTVTETGDAADINLANDRCDSSTTTGNQCTLRAAIEEANDTTGADTIDFDIGGSVSGKTISVASPLPTIAEAVTIDGYTQAGASPNTLVEGNDAVINVVLGGLGAGANADGIVIQASDCTVKGLAIKNFGGAGVKIVGVGGTGTRIEGNFLGIDRNGTTDRGNFYGVSIEGSSSTVGGTYPASRNVISGNDQSGVAISGATGNEIEGNLIGTTADGEGALGNGIGVQIDSANNTVGGTAAGARNVISGNDGFGVFVSGIFSGNENRIEGNFIGTMADGKGDLGNVRGGVTIQNGPDFTAVGGTLPGAANRIAYNGEDGVTVADNGDATGNNILSNRIYDNDELGIDLVGGAENANGVTSNDTGDPDTGSNNLQNFPTITLATKSLALRQTIISGRLNSNPTQDFVVQCFQTEGAPGSDYGEGWRLLDTVPISTNANGRATFICESSRMLLGLQPGQTVSATATNVATGDTSEFSKNRTIISGP